jgi:GAF domain-containing protein
MERPGVWRDRLHRLIDAVRPRDLAGLMSGRLLFIAALAATLLLFERLAPALVLVSATYILFMRAVERGAWSRLASGRIPAPLAPSSFEEDQPEAKIIPINNAFAPAWDDVDDFLQATLDVIKANFDFQTANVFLRGEDENLLVQRAFVSRTRSVARLATIRVGHGLVGWVAANRRPLVVNNLRHEGRTMGYYKAAGEHIASFAAAPVMVGDKVVGVVTLDHQAPDAFPSPATEEALVAVAGLLARVLGAEEIMDASRAEADRIRETRRILRSAYEAEDHDAAATAAVKELVLLADFHAMACYLLDEKNEPRRRASIGFHGIWAHEVKEAVLARAVGQALRQGSPYRLEGAALHAQYRGTPPNGVLPNLLFALPILHQGTPLGALVVETSEVKTLDRRLEGILEDVAADLGGALVRAYRASSAETASKVESEIIRFSSSLLAVESVDAVWERIFSLLFARTGANCAVAYRCDEGRFRLEAVAGCAPGAEIIESDAGLLGWTALAGRPVMASRHDRRRPPIDEGESFLAFPIGPARMARSVVILGAKLPDAFGEAEMELVRGLSETVLPILGTMERLEEARQRLERDAATGLWNAAGFRPRLATLAATGETSVLAIHVERLDRVIGLYGRAEAERIEKRVANLIETFIGRRGIVARLDAATFVAAVKGEHAFLGAELGDLLASSTIAAHHEIALGYRIAVASQAEGLSPADLLAAAEARLFRETPAEATAAA